MGWDGMGWERFGSMKIVSGTLTFSDPGQGPPKTNHQVGVADLIHIRVPEASGRERGPGEWDEESPGGNQGGRDTSISHARDPARTVKSTWTDACAIQ